MRTCRLLVGALLGSVYVSSACAQMPTADLALATQVSTPAYTAMPITFTVVVTNLGPDMAGVNVENQMAVGSTVLTTSVAHSDGREFPGGCFVGTVGSLVGSVSCSVGSIEHQQSATITVVFMATAGPQSIRSWTFSGSTSDPDLANNTVITAFAVLPAPPIPATSPIALWMLFVTLTGIALSRVRA